ncbi:hypothetical protein D3C87_1845940 [compost metagenome]
MQALDNSIDVIVGDCDLDRAGQRGRLGTRDLERCNLALHCGQIGAAAVAGDGVDIVGDELIVGGLGADNAGARLFDAALDDL